MKCVYCQHINRLTFFAKNTSTNQPINKSWFYIFWQTHNQINQSTQTCTNTPNIFTNRLQKHDIWKTNDNVLMSLFAFWWLFFWLICWLVFGFQECVNVLICWLFFLTTWLQVYWLANHQIIVYWWFESLKFDFAWKKQELQ